MGRTALALTLLALSCRAGPRAAPPEGTAHTVTTTPDSLELLLLAPDSVRAGAPIRFTLRLTNRGAAPLDVYLRGRTVTFDVAVADSGGTVVWRRLEGETIPAIALLRTLAPAERLDLTAEWDQRTNAGAPVRPGAYTVRGLLLVEGPPRATAPVALVITPR